MGMPAGGHCEALDRQTSVPTAVSTASRVIESSPRMTTDMAAGCFLTNGHDLGHRAADFVVDDFLTPSHSNDKEGAHASRDRTPLSFSPALRQRCQPERTDATHRRILGNLR